MLADLAAAKLVQLVRAALPADVEVFDAPPAGSQDIHASVWVDDDQSDYDWKALGLHPGNRKERVELKLVIEVYREAETHRAAQVAARTDATAIERAIEEHALGDTCDLGGLVSDALVDRARRTWSSSDKGWTRRVELRVVANHHPG